MSAVEQLIGKLGEVCAGLPDKRKGPARDGDYTMADIGLSAFSIFFMQSPSFLGHQRALAEGHGKSNCQTLFGMQSISSDNYIRLMLDGAAPAAFDGLFLNAIEAAGPLTPFHLRAALVMGFASAPPILRVRRESGGLQSSQPYGWNSAVWHSCDVDIIYNFHNSTNFPSYFHFLWQKYFGSKPNFSVFCCCPLRRYLPIFFVLHFLFLFFVE